MNIRSMSLLPRISAITPDDLFETSQFDPEGSKYNSKSIQFSTIDDQIVHDAVDAVSSTYNLENENGPIDISALAKQINTLSNDSCDINGIKHMNDWQYIDRDFPTSDEFAQYGGEKGKYIIPNVQKVSELIDKSPIYISTTDSVVAEGNPLPMQSYSSANDTRQATLNSVPNMLSYSLTYGKGKFYYWQLSSIGSGASSSTSIWEENSRSMSFYQEMRDTGNLVMWGWLADDGNADPNLAYQNWVALYAQMKTEGNDTTELWVPVQVQPWIKGSCSNTLQYVGFNLPVKKGLRLKIKTGFNVVNAQHSAFQTAGSLTFADGWIPNSFFGYIIK